MINKAIRQAINHIKRTSETTPQVVSQLWSQFPLSEEDVQTLAMEGLVVRIGNVRRNPNLLEDEQTVTGSFGRISIPEIISSKPEGRFVHVQVTRTKETRILHDTMLTINNANVALIDFTARDCSLYIRSQSKIVDGLERHIEVAEYIRDRLTTLNKKKVSDLAVGEQHIIAQKWRALAKGLDGKEFNAANFFKSVEEELQLV